MKLSEVVVITGSELIENNTRGWCTCFLKGINIKHNNHLRSEYGKGRNKSEARKNYVNCIQGQTLVKNAYNNDIRWEVTLPSTISIK